MRPLFVSFFQKFIAFIERNRARFSKLRILTVQFLTAPGMTVQSLIAIMRYADELDELNCLTPLPSFSAQDKVNHVILVFYLKLYTGKLIRNN
jgi:hypothetical protein